VWHIHKVQNCKPLFRSGVGGTHCSIRGVVRPGDAIQDSGHKVCDRIRLAVGDRADKFGLYLSDLSNNNFDRDIPEHFPPNLVELDLSNNKFSGNFPDSLMNVSSLQIIAAPRSMQSAAPRSMQSAAVTMAHYCMVYGNHR
jgi:hypothetical protein